MTAIARFTLPDMQARSIRVDIIETRKYFVLHLAPGKSELFARRYLYNTVFKEFLHFAITLYPELSTRSSNV